MNHVKLANAKRMLAEADEKIRVLKALVKDYEDVRWQWIEDIRAICDHNNCLRTRHYSSGMHRGEYSYTCQTCDQEISETTYRKAANQKTN